MRLSPCEWITRAALGRGCASKPLAPHFFKDRKTAGKPLNPESIFAVKGSESASTVRWRLSPRLM